MTDTELPSTTTPGVDDVRRVVSAALSFYADHHAARFTDSTRADYLAGLDDTSAAVASEVAVARTLASRVPAWTIDVRIAAFLLANDGTISAELVDLLLTDGGAPVSLLTTGCDQCGDGVPLYRVKVTHPNGTQADNFDQLVDHSSALASPVFLRARADGQGSIIVWELNPDTSLALNERISGARIVAYAGVDPVTGHVLDGAARTWWAEASEAVAH